AAVSARANMGPTSGMADRVSADLSRKLGDDIAARSELASAVGKEPKDVDTRLEYGWRLVGAGELALAREQAQHVLDVDGAPQTGDGEAFQIADAHLLLGEIARREGKTAEAAAHCDDAQK